jgi:hypothetical protein
MHIPEPLWQLFVCILLVVQGIAQCWPAFSRKTIPAWLSEQRWWGLFMKSRLFGVTSIIVGLLLGISSFWSRPISTSAWESETNHLESIVGSTFVNQEVEIDGKHFEDCKFSGVTLVFRGKHLFDISHCEIHAPLRFKMANGPVFSAARVLWELSADICKQSDGKVCPTDRIMIHPLEETPYIKERMHRQSNATPVTAPHSSPDDFIPGTQTTHTGWKLSDIPRATPLSSTPDKGASPH